MGPQELIIQNEDFDAEDLPCCVDCENPECEFCSV